MLTNNNGFKNDSKNQLFFIPNEVGTLTAVSATCSNSSISLDTFLSSNFLTSPFADLIPITSLFAETKVSKLLLHHQFYFLNIQKMEHLYP